MAKTNHNRDAAQPSKAQAEFSPLEFSSSSSGLPTLQPQTFQKPKRVGVASVAESPQRSSSLGTATSGRESKRVAVIDSANGESDGIQTRTIGRRTRASERRAPAIVVYGESDENSLEQVKRGLPSWFVSLIVHLSLIIILALMTLPGLVEDRITLNISDSIAQEIPSVEFELSPLSPDLEELEQSTESQDILSDSLADSSTPEVVIGNYASDLGESEGLGDGDLLGVSLPEKQVAPALVAGEKKDGIEYFGTTAYGNNFVFVVDCSGSMSYPVRSYRTAFNNAMVTRWDKAKEETKRAISQLTEEQTFLIYAYNSQTFGMGGLDPFQTQLVKATDENKNAAYRWLDVGNPNDGTYPKRAVDLALKQKPDAIFLLSDGEFGDNTARFTLQANQPRIWEDGNERVTPIHTIAFGRDGAKTLKWIADRNNGLFTRLDF